MRLSIVIPAHNESSRIEPTLTSYRKVFGEDTEVIAVANGCSDDTAAIARRVAAAHPGITVLDYPEKIGKGGAVRQGFACAKGTYVGFVDADAATSPEEFQRIAAAAESADGAIASRCGRGAVVVGRSPLRSLMSRLFSLLVRILFGLPFQDTQCGAKVFHRRFLAEYLATSRVNDLAFDVELLLLLNRAGAKIAEVPTHWVAKPGSSALGTPQGFIKHGFIMARSLGRLWLRARRLPRSGA